MHAHVRRLQLVEYEDGLRMQERLVLERQQGTLPDQLLVLEHPHVFTLGRRADPSHILAQPGLRRQLDVDVFESVRGGDVTYHGPGQIILYPILALPVARQDVVKYVRDLEEVMIRTLADYGITAGRVEGLSGAWVGDNKLGAIGVRMSRWVTSHGIGLNVNTDLSYFNLIVPCGIRDHGVTSISRELGHPVSLEAVTERLLFHMAQVFQLELDATPAPVQTIQTLVMRRQPDGIQLLNIRRVPALGGFWQPVTGRVEPGERPEDAAVREVMEETRLAGPHRNLDYRHTFMLDPQVFQAPRWPVPTFIEEHAFVMEVPAGAEPVLDPSTHDAFEWLDLQTSLERQQWAGNRAAIRRLARAEGLQSALMKEAADE